MLNMFSVSVNTEFLSLTTMQQSFECIYTIIYVTHPFLKNSLCAVAFFFFFWSHRAACRILFPQSGIESAPPTLEVKILTSGSPEKSLDCLLLNHFSAPKSLMTLYTSLNILNLTNHIPIW